MKFDMGATTLATLTKRTSTSSEDLGSLVRDLVAAAEPLEGRFDGEGRAAFNSFKTRTDEVAVEINAALSAVLEGIAGMDRAFVEGEAQMVDTTMSAQSSSDFDAARFGSSR